MGVCCCRELTAEEQAQNEIEQKGRELEKAEKTLHRILLLGPGDSGKSTIIKQMKKQRFEEIQKRKNNDEVSENIKEKWMKEKKDYISVIRSSILKNMHTLCVQSVLLTERGYEGCEVDESLTTERDYFREEPNTTIEADELITNPEYITKLWNDKGIKQTFKNRAKFHIPESAKYFFDKFDEINEKDYVPSSDDYVRFRLRTSGISSETFENYENHHKYELIDVGGQRSERKKWKQVILPGIEAVLYIFSVGEYDKLLFEDNNVKRITEALTLFEETIKGGFFDDGRPCIMFLNKFDLFQQRINDVPLEEVLEDFKFNPQLEEDRCEQSISYIEQLFKDLWNKKFEDQDGSLSNTLTMYRTFALQTDNIVKLMHDIQRNLITKMLNQVGLN